MQAHVHGSSSAGAQVSLDRDAWSSVLRAVAPASTQDLSVQEVSAVHRFVHAHRPEAGEVEGILRLGRRHEQRQGRGELTEESAERDDRAQCRRNQLAGVITNMELRRDIGQRLAWDFRSLDQECSGRLALHRCVLLFAANLGSKFSRRIWSEFRAEQRRAAEEIGELGGASLDDVRRAVVDVAIGKHSELGMSGEEVRQLAAQELREECSRSLDEYRGLQNSLRPLEDETEQPQRQARGRELREAAKRRLADFHAMVVAATTAAAAESDVADGAARLSAASGVGGHDSHGDLDKSFASITSVQSAGQSSAMSQADVEEQAIVTALERKYDVLSEKLLASTMPWQSAKRDLRQLHANVGRLMRAGRLDEAEKQLTRHSSTADVSMLLGDIAAGDGGSVAATSSPPLLLGGGDFIAISSPGRALVELRLRESREREYMGRIVERGVGAGGGRSSAKLTARLKLHEVVASSEDGFEAAALVVGLLERAHRPGTLDSFHPDKARCRQLALRRLPQLLNSADLFQDFAVLAKRLETDALLPSGAEAGADRHVLQQLVLQLLLHCHQTERSALVWLLEQSTTNPDSAPDDGTVSEVLDGLTGKLENLNKQRTAWLSGQPGSVQGSVLEHQSLFCAAAKLARGSSWRWYHGDIMAMSLPARTRATDADDVVTSNCSQGLLTELLALLQEVQLEEIGSTMAEIARKDAEALRSQVSAMHGSLVQLRLHNVASVLLRPPASERKWREALRRASVQAKFRALQDVFLHEALACGDGGVTSQKEWNAMSLDVKRVALANLRINEGTNHSESSSLSSTTTARRVNTAVERSAREALAKATSSSSSSSSTKLMKRSVLCILETMCRESVPGLLAIDRQMPATVRALVLGAACFADALQLACGKGEMWAACGTALPWQQCYLGKERLDLLNVEPIPPDANPVPVAWPSPVAVAAASAGTLQVVLHCQVLERQMLAELVAAVLRLTLVWREVAAMEEVELKARLQELTGSAVVYWQKCDDKTRASLHGQYRQCVQETAVVTLQLLQESGDESAQEAGDVYASPVLRRNSAIAAVWQRCYALQAMQLRQLCVYLQATATSRMAVDSLLSFSQQRLATLQATSASTMSVIDQLLFAGDQDATDPFAIGARRLCTQLEMPVLALLLPSASFSESSARQLDDIVRAIDACPGRKVRAVRRHFLALVFKQHSQHRPASAKAAAVAAAAAATAATGQSVMDAAEELVILEQSLAAADSRDTRQLADILALHPGAEDSFQELCWLMAEVGLMPRQKEKAGEMDKTSAAVSVVKALADFSERQSAAMRKWSSGFARPDCLLQLQAALAYQLHVLDCLSVETTDISTADISTALLQLCIKSMLTLRMPQGHSTRITYSRDWYYQNQLLAQRYVQLWQSRTCLALTYEAELPAVVDRERRRVADFLSTPAAKAICCVSSRVTVIREMLNHSHHTHQLEMQILLLVLQLCDLDRPGLDELTDKSPDDLKAELQKLQQDYKAWAEVHSERTKTWTTDALKPGDDITADTLLSGDDVTSVLDILGEAAAVRVVLTMWQCDARESRDKRGRAPEELEPMAVLLLRQLVCLQQQTEDDLLKETVTVEGLETLRGMLLERLADGVFCRWRSLVATVFSSADFSEPMTRSDSGEVSGGESRRAGDDGHFGMRLYRLTTIDLYGALDTKLQEKMQRKNKKVRKRHSSKTLAPPQELVAEAQQPASLDPAERTKEYEDKHRMMMSDLLTTYNRMRDDKIKNHEADRSGGDAAGNKRLRFSSSSTNVLRHAEAEEPSDKKRASRQLLKSANVAKRLQRRRGGRRPSRPASAESSDVRKTDPASGQDQAEGATEKRDSGADSVAAARGDREEEYEEEEDDDDDVALPGELGDDDVADDGEGSQSEGDESEEDEFRPLTAWATGRARTSNVGAGAGAGAARPVSSAGHRRSSVDVSGVPSRPLTRMEEEKLNMQRKTSSSSADSAALTAADEQDRRESKTAEDTELKAKRQLLKGKMMVDVDADPNGGDRRDSMAIQTATITQEMAKKEKGRQQQEALRRRKERLAARDGSVAAAAAASPDTRKRSSNVSVGGGGSPTPQPSVLEEADDMEALRGTMATRMQEEKDRQQEKLRTRSKSQNLSPNPLRRSKVDE